MALDLGETVIQLDQLAQHLGNSRADRTGRLEAFLAAASRVTTATAKEKTGYEPGRPFLAAQVTGALVGAYSPTAPPPPTTSTARSRGPGAPAPLRVLPASSTTLVHTR